MINLSEHVCYHCKHLNRKSRTRHGWLADQYRFYDEQIASLVEQRKYGSIGYYKHQRDRVFQLMRQLEEGQNSVIDNYNARDRAKKTSWIPWYPENKEYWDE